MPVHTAEAQREAELARYAVLSGGPSHDLEAMVSLAAELCDAPMAALDLLTGTHRYRVAAVGTPVSVSRLEDSLSAVVVDDPGIVVVPDVLVDERFAGKPAVTGVRGRVRFYGSAPLVTERGVAIGRLGVFADEPRGLTPRQARALRRLAGRVVDVLELRLRSFELEESLTELTRTRDELHRSNKRLAYFAGQVSHDLRTPLTAMMLNIEALAQEPRLAGDEYAEGLMAAALDAGRRMSNLVDDILDFAQVGASLRMVDVDMQRVLAEIRDDVTATLGELGGDLRVGPMPVVVGDERQLYSLVLNLVSNGVKFTQPGVAPVVEVGALRLEERWRFEVRDNGIGIPDEALAVIFMPFARGETDAPGHGIGLATAKRVVEAHGGRIGVERRPGGGTTAWFELPD